jgi:methylated-DNA-[protein]-cysteine S-methyltransferase
MTPFAKKVYKIVAKIPLGRVRTYKWVAAKAGAPGAVRAVGSALRRNPYPLVIPCHRVVRSDGDCGNYAWGRMRKARLLELEKRVADILR